MTIELFLFAAYTAAETPRAFQWAGQLLKVVRSHGGYRPPFNTWFLEITHVSS